MVGNFNLANEHETLGLIEKAIEYYEASKGYAVKVNNQDMLMKINEILSYIQKKQ